MNHEIRIYPAFTVSIVCILLATALLPSVTRAAPSASLLQPTSVPPLPTRPTPQPAPSLPPRPTPQPTPRRRPTGGSIELRAQFPHTWPWAEVPWQDLWTIVQWQDEWGSWHDVEGWRGTLDHVVIGESGEVVGKGIWWVAKSDLGKGPFRWVVYWRKEGKLLATSESFYLPGTVGEIVRIEVVLEP